MDKVLLSDLRKQNKYTHFFQDWANQEFGKMPDPKKVVKDLEKLSNQIGMQEGLYMACFDYKNLNLAFFAGNVEELTGYPSSMFRNKGMETSFTMIHPDDRPELFRFQEIVFKAFHGLSMKEKHTFEFSYTTRWVHRTTLEVHWMMARVKPYFIDESGNFAMDFHVIVKLMVPPKISGYDWNYSFVKDDGERVVVSKNEPTEHEVKLTKKEKQVVKLILDGQSSKEIGEALNISINTVGTHRKNILKKLGARNVTEMIKILSSYEF
ncbi:LuxR C-terminal-related transcriptional regulator [Algoriphagus sediminis]|uniref:LuxR C-terminal-related transcriptional regulator n=1 Tax=Algoriphagus sediminis TaxID=3057113 RepID=A0ABT7YC48_9BACT|nr:LuxR C-terminal-related transcriptional regulator [Algoriphagus sediminis]MDN3203970.1 LuxR C-terminal-related transcriptional regulator [Algoriphagus sediminis]